ncbi:glycosyltransferase [Mesorhizobium sp.]|uniref:glycosyltransferase n=1 Tax=Mesorhizobium sp. TaxID=1871066 RepID=UPI00338F2131
MDSRWPGWTLMHEPSIERSQHLRSHRTRVAAAPPRQGGIASAFRRWTSPPAAFLRRYGIDGAYLHVSNQFRAHKNHAVVIDALGRARVITVVSTGNVQDRRNSQLVEMLIQRAREANCVANFKMLGIVPYAELAALMKYSAGVYNPSFFEGWSMAVEAAKSLGKTLVLSDIPVHREQAPQHAVYFAPDAPADLCDRMLDILDSYSPDADQERMRKARAGLPGRVAVRAVVRENRLGSDGRQVLMTPAGVEG